MIRKMLEGGAVFVLAVLLLEVVSRVLFTIVADINREQRKEDPWYVVSRDFAWERKPGFDGLMSSVHRRFDARGFLQGDAEKLSSPRKKILFLGDSNTFGNGLPADSAYPALVESLLPDAVSINLATPGYSSYQGMITLRRALDQFTPDFIIASFNYNDRRSALDRNAVDGREGFSRLFEEATAFSLEPYVESVYVARGLRYLFRWAGFIGTSPSPTVRVDTLQARVSPEAYENNLRSIARMASQAGVPLAFILLRDSYHQTRYLREGLAALARSQVDSAAEAFRIQLRYAKEFEPLTRRFLAQALRTLGDEQNAERALLMIPPARRIDGGSLIRPDAEYNDIVRRVAKETGAIVIDGAAVLDSSPSVYYDFCHFDTRGHRMVAERVAATISPLLKSARR